MATLVEIPIQIRKFLFPRPLLTVLDEMVIVLKRGKLRGEENRFPCLNSIETFPPLKENEIEKKRDFSTERKRKKNHSHDLIFVRTSRSSTVWKTGKFTRSIDNKIIRETNSMQ